MDTLKATESGLKDIRQQVDYICRNNVDRRGRRGRGVQDKTWLEEASTVLQPDWEKIPYAEGISLASWKRFRAGKEAITKPAFRAYCQILDLNWQVIAGIHSGDYPYGFKSAPERRNIFNSYQGKRVIHNLWTDPVWFKNGGYEKIQPYIKPKVISNFLRLEFVRQGWGVNTTIRPENDIPVDTSQFQSMKVSFRSFDGQLVGLRVRIVDANYVHWGYGETLAYETKDLSTNSRFWQTADIPLKESCWFHFPYDGFPPKEGQRYPNFDAINLVVFEVGLEATTSGSKATIAKLETNNNQPATIDIKPVKFF